MQIIIADRAGYCFGVKKAINTIDKMIEEKHEATYTYGPIIHNPQVVEYFKERGVNAINSIDDIPENCNIIIRTHGISKNEHELLCKKNCNIIDRTCPFVKKVQKIAQDYHKKGYKIIIIGDPAHPEVKGVNGWCENQAIIVDSVESAKKIGKINDACVVAQTTMTNKKWDEILNVLKSKINNLVTFNTICDATTLRQKSAVELAQKVGIMLVIGGLNSSNTKKLYELCKKYCNNTFHIETKEQLPLDKIKKSDIIGITAGASTPDWIIDSVVRELQKQVKGRD